MTTAPRPQRRLAAILAADVVGFSRMIGLDEAGTLTALHSVWSERLTPTVAAHGGRIVKTMGDGALVEFASAVDAVECAVAFQEAMARHNAARPEQPAIEFRIGVNVGDIVVEGDDILGDGVNVAARLEALAPAGGILVSDAVRAQVRSKVAVALTDGGELALKNIEAPVRVWRWGGDASRAAAPAAALPPLDEHPSIAVLPFANMSGDPEQEFFADGLVEDIITTLSKLAELRVIARNSSFAFKGQAVDIREVAQRLGVRYVLQGSVRKGGSRVRITAQLVDAKAGSHIWAERYDRAIDDIFAVQDEITLTLATEMQVRLTEGEQARLHYTTTSNVEAWTEWVRGLSHHRHAVNRESQAAALACWQRALALEPGSATLHAMVGFVHVLDARFGWSAERPTALGRAQSYSDQALQLDPDNPDAHTTRALALLLQSRFDEAAVHARRAVDLAPGAAGTATSTCFVLAFAGYPDEAVVHGERSMALSPMRPGFMLGNLGNAYRLAGRFEEAVGCFEAYHAKNPGFGLVDLVLAYRQLGRWEQAAHSAALLMAMRRDFAVAGWASSQPRADSVGLQADIAALRAAGLPMS